MVLNNMSFKEVAFFPVAQAYLKFSAGEPWQCNYIEAQNLSLKTTKKI